MKHLINPFLAFFVVAGALVTSAQETPRPPQAGRGSQAPQFVSPEVLPARRMTFRIYAPQAQAVRLSAGDIPGVGNTTTLTKAARKVLRPSLSLSVPLERAPRTPAAW